MRKTTQIAYLRLSEKHFLIFLNNTAITFTTSEAAHVFGSFAYLTVNVILNVM